MVYTHPAQGIKKPRNIVDRLCVLFSKQWRIISIWSLYSGHFAYCLFQGIVGFLEALHFLLYSYIQRKKKKGMVSEFYRSTNR